jgi:hypothetical protein
MDQRGETDQNGWTKKRHMHKEVLSVSEFYKIYLISVAIFCSVASDSCHHNRNSTCDVVPCHAHWVWNLSIYSQLFKWWPRGPVKAPVVYESWERVKKICYFPMFHWNFGPFRKNIPSTTVQRFSLPLYILTPPIPPNIIFLNLLLNINTAYELWVLISFEKNTVKF